MKRGQNPSFDVILHQILLLPEWYIQIKDTILLIMILINYNKKSAVKIRWRFQNLNFKPEKICSNKKVERIEKD